MSSFSLGLVLVVIALGAVPVFAKCGDGYGLVNGKCVACKDVYCGNCDGNQNSCTECFFYGYGLTSSKACKTCKVCKACKVPNCETCDASLKKCIKCGIGPSDDYGDVSYGFGPGGKCVPCKDKNCQECPKFGKCLHCNDGYILDNKTGNCITG